jgi:hypothetical protein
MPLVGYPGRLAARERRIMLTSGDFCRRRGPYCNNCHRKGRVPVITRSGSKAVRQFWTLTGLSGAAISSGSNERKFLFKQDIKCHLPRRRPFYLVYRTGDADLPQVADRHACLRLESEPRTHKELHHLSVQSHPPPQLPASQRATPSYESLCPWAR